MGLPHLLVASGSKSVTAVELFAENRGSQAFVDMSRDFHHAIMR